jgi:hypothetical protein
VNERTTSFFQSFGGYRCPDGVFGALDWPLCEHGRDHPIDFLGVAEMGARMVKKLENEHLALPNHIPTEHLVHALPGQKLSLGVVDRLDSALES